MHVVQAKAKRKRRTGRGTNDEQSSPYVALGTPLATQNVHIIEKTYE